MSGHLKALLQHIGATNLWRYKLVMQLDGVEKPRDYWADWSLPMQYEDAIAELAELRLRGEIQEVEEVCLTDSLRSTSTG